MVILPELIYRFDAIPIKFLAELFRNRQVDPKVYMKMEGLRRAKTISKRTKLEQIHFATSKRYKAPVAKDIL